MPVHKIVVELPSGERIRVVVKAFAEGGDDPLVSYRLENCAPNATITINGKQVVRTCNCGSGIDVMQCPAATQECG